MNYHYTTVKELYLVIISVVLRSVKRCFEQQIGQHIFGSFLS